MKSFPAVNWWKGNLRPYESFISLATRFSVLNGIDLKQCNSFFRGHLEAGFSLDDVDIRWINEILGEDIQVTKSVLNMEISLPYNIYLSSVDQLPRYSLRYCAECSKIGYHSYLHEQPWMARCPFHQTPLHSTCAGKDYTKIQVRRGQALLELMQTACPYWPASSPEPFFPESYECFRALAEWMPRVIKVAKQFDQGEFWYCTNTRPPRPHDNAQLLGMVRALEHIPEALTPLFTDVQEGWKVEVMHFPIQAKEEFERISDLNIDLLWMFYKCAAAYSSQHFPFTENINLVRQALDKRHPKCHCKWGREVVSFGTHWIGVSPNHWPHWQITCPYDVARQEFELAVGLRLDFLSDRKSYKERLEYIKYAKELNEIGLVKFNMKLNSSPDEYFYFSPNFLPYMEWIGTPFINLVLENITQFEVESFSDSLFDWLDDIECGEDPENCPPQGGAIHLAKTEDGLLLLKWWRKKKKH
ncbi:hypothetical protein [Janthinobacterium agaricidamnosum]|uniref:hypothetical protein n=1 Tax=Janthinobacterium agaricidamnosum TaxID=55508 RepID=UPI0013CE81FF|nr:hypothetical protein [Janthinobacterium agaricidamnosum]